MLPKQNRLSTRHQFKKVRYLSNKYGQQTVSPYFYLSYSYADATAPTEVGFVIGTKLLKSAVARNRLKRVFRSCVRESLPDIKNGYWIVIVPRKASIEATYEKISADINKAIQNICISGQTRDKSL